MGYCENCKNATDEALEAENATLRASLAGAREILGELEVHMMGTHKAIVTVLDSLPAGPCWGTIIHEMNQDLEAIGGFLYETTRPSPQATPSEPWKKPTIERKVCDCRNHERQVCDICTGVIFIDPKDRRDNPTTKPKATAGKECGFCFGSGKRLDPVSTFYVTCVCERPEQKGKEKR